MSDTEEDTEPKQSRKVEGLQERIEHLEEVIQNQNEQIGNLRDRKRSLESQVAHLRSGLLGVIRLTDDGEAAELASKALDEVDVQVRTEDGGDE